MAIATNFPSINPTLLLDFANSGRVDPRVTFTRASSATFFDQTGVLRTAATNVPRLDYNPSTLAALGFLIEESRTNSIRNNTMQGAVAGTPGTLPTNWQIAGSGAGTLSRDIVGTGVANGIAYIDIRYYGTASTTGLTIACEPNAGGPAASAGQTWTGSNYVAIVGGSVTNLNSIRAVTLAGRTSGGAGTADTVNSGDQKSVLTATMQRFSATITLADATTAALQPGVGLFFSSGVAIDITLRIGLPQLELGAFATSVIPTTTTAVTRAADIASVNTLSPWFNAAESTLYLEFVLVGVKSSGGQPLLEIDNGTSNERMRMVATASNQMQNVTTVSNATSGNSSTPVTIYAANTTYKVAVAIKLDDMQSFVGGVAGTIDTTTLLPVGLTTLRFAANALVGTSSNVWFRRFTYYPRRLSAAEGAAITA